VCDVVVVVSSDFVVQIFVVDFDLLGGYVEDVFIWFVDMVWVIFGDDCE